MVDHARPLDPAQDDPRRAEPAGGVLSQSAFARARGPGGRLATPVSRRARRRRAEQFVRLAKIDASTKIVDIGSGGSGLIGLAPHLNVTGVDLHERPEYPGHLVVADATTRLPFADHEFDVAYCNSVIEHIHPEKRRGYADEIHRVARGWYVQTPAMSFPIEPHCLLPGAHWLSPPLRKRYWRLGAGSNVDEITLLRRRELEALFGPAFRERLAHSPRVGSRCVFPDLALHAGPVI